MPSGNSIDRLIVVLVATRNPLNIGAVARAMANFGCSELRLVDPYDVAFREARSAMGGASLLRKAKVFSSVADSVSDCRLVVGTTAARDRRLEHSLRTLQQGTLVIRRRLAAGKVAVLFGSEKRGLSNQDFSHCDWLMRIPTRSEQSSMNLGQAVAVCLYEIARAAKLPAASPETGSSSAELERVTELLHEALTASGYAKSGQEKDPVRRLVRRLKPSSADSQLLSGMLRQMLWKMRH